MIYKYKLRYNNNQNHHQNHHCWYCCTGWGLAKKQRNQKVRQKKERASIIQ